MPKVSVIVPVYGVEKYIERCARSLFEQTLDDIEYIFVDDCSPDRSIEILEKVIEEYPHRLEHIKIMHHKINKGLAQARQTGLKVAIGEYIAHCDSDDWIDHDLYEVAYIKAIANNLDVVAFNGEKTDGTDVERIKSNCYATIDECIDAMMHRKMWWSLCNKIFKRKIYDNYIIYPQDNMGEDMCLTLQLMTYCKTIGYINKKYYYYEAPSSIMAEVGSEKQKGKYEQLCRNISKIKDFFIERKIYARYHKGINYLEYNASMVLFSIVNDYDCRNLWMNSFRHSAFSVLLDNAALLKERIRIVFLIIQFLKLKYLHNVVN